AGKCATRGPRGEFGGRGRARCLQRGDESKASAVPAAATIPHQGDLRVLSGELRTLAARRASLRLVPVGVHGFDAEPIETQAMSFEQREHEALAGFVSTEERAHPLGRLERPARLRERLTHDALRVLAD